VARRGCNHPAVFQHLRRRSSSLTRCCTQIPCRPFRRSLPGLKEFTWETGIRCRRPPEKPPAAQILAIAAPRLAAVYAISSIFSVPPSPAGGPFERAQGLRPLRLHHSFLVVLLNWRTAAQLRRLQYSLF
jgi:hypothetical protein